MTASSPSRSYRKRRDDDDASSSNGRANGRTGHESGRSMRVFSPRRKSEGALPVVEPRPVGVPSVGSPASHREPMRSFIHGSVRESSIVPNGSTQNNARSVREETAELASYVLSDRRDSRSRSFRSRLGPPLHNRAGSLLNPGVSSAVAVDSDEEDEGDDCENAGPATATATATVRGAAQGQEDGRNGYNGNHGRSGHDGPSLLSNLLRQSSLKKPPSKPTTPTISPTTSTMSTMSTMPTMPPSGTANATHRRSISRGRTALSERSPLLRPKQSTTTTTAAAAAAANYGTTRLRDGHGDLDRTNKDDDDNNNNNTDEDDEDDGNGAIIPGAQGIDEENQKHRTTKRWRAGAAGILGRVGSRISGTLDRKRWDRGTVWRKAVVAPASCLPAVAVGLLLNILDALSYGMILFPLGEPIFAGLGSAGISIFYVSTIISQLTFSAGSIFKGAIGSELIEVVPFFHNMAQTITDTVGEDAPDAVIATTIVSYALSSIMTGLVFFLTGWFRLGYVAGFIPRHILIGCIGGVGWFLVTTGFEVSARLDSNSDGGDGGFEYNLDTLHRLLAPDTAPLWACPLALAIVLFWGQAKVASKYFLPLYILAIPLVFYVCTVFAGVLDPASLRRDGWIFEGPPPGEPWWYFYTLYKFNLVRWDAVAKTIPAMLALTFFGILHVPINVPALALNCGEDHADLDAELRLHGYSNALSGLAGSVQNYLVYANTVFFVRSGGDRRLAGAMLAALTFLVMMAGPSLIGFIPVMMVGTLIFDLGFELLLEAVWLSQAKLKWAEYLTVVVIVLVMGIYDFVVGIGVGIMLALIALVVQTAHVSPVRGSYTGDVVTSTVRRNPSQQHYLRRAGGQIRIVKLTGFLFFGTIVGVEREIRALLDDAAFAERPIRFLVLDMRHVTGLDYSAGEAFNTISRLLGRKAVVLVLGGVVDQTAVGQHLRAVGLGSGGTEVLLLPDLNSALESCENELLRTLYAGQEEIDNAITRATTATAISKSTPIGTPDDGPADSSSSPWIFILQLSPPPLLSSSLSPPLSPSFLSFPSHHSPRQSHLHEAARTALTESSTAQAGRRWRSFREPLRLILHIFNELSDRKEDFWYPAALYFARCEYPAGTTLYRRGEPALGFYLVESGVLRAEYELPQGRFHESIVAGTTCGELPFFSETERTATVVLEAGDGDSASSRCVLWLLGREGWERMRREEAEVAQELLKVSLKLTSERMTAITSYVLAMAG